MRAATVLEKSMLTVERENAIHAIRGTYSVNDSNGIEEKIKETLSYLYAPEPNDRNTGLMINDISNSVS